MQLAIASRRAQYPANVSQNSLQFTIPTLPPILPPSKHPQEKENIRYKSIENSSRSALLHDAIVLNFHFRRYPALSKETEDETYFVETVPTLESLSIKIYSFLQTAFTGNYFSKFRVKTFLSPRVIHLKR